MLKKYDLVKVIKSEESVYSHFEGAVGIITEIKEHHLGYPYLITFVEDTFRRESEHVGGLLWNEDEIEGV